MFDQFIQFHKHLLNTSCVWNADGQTHGSGRYQGNLSAGPQNLKDWTMEIKFKRILALGVSDQTECFWSSDWRPECPILILDLILPSGSYPVSSWFHHPSASSAKMSWHSIQEVLESGQSWGRDHNFSFRAHPTSIYWMPTMCKARWWIQR